MSESSLQSNQRNTNDNQLIQVAVICLSMVSFFTTANGMNSYIFKNFAISYAASAAIQGILLNMSMKLPVYFSNVYKNKHNFFTKVLFWIVILLLTLVTIFCSSYFSYIYIADVVHKDSWDADSELLVQQTYRKELYNAKDYSYAYRNYLENSLGEKIIILEELAEGLSENEYMDNSQIDWTQERLRYENTEMLVDAYMTPVVDIMENAIEKNPSQNLREQAARAIEDARANIYDRKEVINEALEKCSKNINDYNSHITSLRSQINNATVGTDVSSLENSLNNTIRSLQSETEKRTSLEMESTESDVAISRLQIYETYLGLNNSTSVITIKSQLLEMQTEFFAENPNEKELLDKATTVFTSLRNATTYEDSDQLSYTNLLVQMNGLILNLKDYIVIKTVESELESEINDFTSKDSNTESEVKTVESEPESEITDFTSKDSNTESEAKTVESESESGTTDSTSKDSDTESKEWMADWRKSLEKLKSIIGSMPIYTNVGESDNQNLTDSQIEILQSYDRNDASNNLDDMIRLYLTEHNELYQGLIYLTSPYNKLAIFCLVLACLFDIVGFIFGFIAQKDSKEQQSNDNISNYLKISENMNDENEKNDENEITWSILPTLNRYRILTGDYEKKDGIYIYKIFENGVLQEWSVKDKIFNEYGIYIEDSMDKEEVKKVENIEQEISFKGQKEDPQDGIYLNCCLKFDEGSLFLIEDGVEDEIFLLNLDEYVPVHIYNFLRGESHTVAAQELIESNFIVQMAVIALNETGTRVASIYMLK